MEELIRHVALGDTRYELKLFATGLLCGYGAYTKTRLAYEFGKTGEKPLFEGDDFCCSPMHAEDSNETLRSLLTFLTLRPGDTDEEYFENYTEDQLEYCSSDAEELSLWAYEEHGEPFKNLDDRSDVEEEEEQDDLDEMEENINRSY